MTETKQSAQNRKNNIVPSVFWGTIALDVIAMLVFGYFLAFLQGLDKTPIVYVGMIIFLAILLAALSSLVLTIRGRQRLGAEIVLYSLAVLGIMMIVVFQGRVLTASFSILTISVITILYLLPRQSRRWYLSVSAVSCIMMWLIEWLDPSWRIQIGAAAIGPAAVIVFALILTVAIIRQTWGRSIRNNLMLAFIGIALVVAGTLVIYVYTSTNKILSQSLQGELTQHVDGVSASIGNLLNEQVNTVTTLSLNKLLIQAAIDTNNAYVGNANAVQTELDAKDKQWRAADAANNNNDPLVRENLNNQVAQELIRFQKTFPNHVEVFMTDVHGGLLGTTNRTSDYYQADEDWWQAAYNNGQGGVYISNPEFDESANALAMQIALPIRSEETGKIVGILRSTYLASAFNVILDEQIGQTGITEIYFPGEEILYYHDGQLDSIPTEKYAELQAIANQGMVEIAYEGIPSVTLQTPMRTLEGASAVNNLGWVVVFHQDQNEAFAPANAQIRGALIVMSIIMALAVLAAIGLSLFLVSPITQLTQAAQEVASGNLDKRAMVSTSDEIGVLASTFNSMTSQLQDTLAGLEQRVADRTRNLELAAEVGRAVSQVRTLDVMLEDACDLILKEFNLYYVQVYLSDPSRTNLILEAGTGDVGAQLLGRGHSLRFDVNSINGRAAVEKRSIVIADTSQSASFRPNPLLPETRGEIAVPLIIADKVVGVLNMQSDKPGILTDEILPAFEALAGQVAVAVQNANLLAENEQARAEVEKQARRLIRTGWNEHLDAIHKPEQLGFVFDRNNVTPLADADDSQLTEGGHSISAPITVTGEPLGALTVGFEDDTRAEQMGELVNIVARQVSQQIENLRLLESAERYRFEAEKTASLQTLEGWQDYTRAQTENKLGYLYNMNEVRPYHLGQDDGMFKFALPLKARNETIGKLSVDGLSSEDQESVGFVNTIAERLSTHIESLRQYEQAQTALMQSEKLFEASRALTQATDLQELVEATVKTLNIPVVNRAILGAFSYNAAGELETMTDIANWWNGTGTEVAAIGTSYSANALKLLSVFLSDKPLYFNDTFTDERMGTAGMQVAKSLNIRSGAVLPLLLGTRQIGILMLQAEEPHNFIQDEIRLFSALAPQISTVLENRRQFERAQKQAERESTLNIINQKIQSATSVEAVLQIAARELGHALGAPMTIAQLSLKDTSASS
ncbi:hypothetical protein MASR2M66_10210 [Chloroflexota bacterium]